MLLCMALQLGARRLAHGLGHPRDGGWLLPALPERRRARWLLWATNLRARCGAGMSGSGIQDLRAWPFC